MSTRLTTRRFDATREELPLPRADVLILSDVFVTDDLATAFAARVAEAQSLGFARAGNGADGAGSGFTMLDYVGHMEDMDGAWSHVLSSLGLPTEDARTAAAERAHATQLAAVVNVNNQQGRRGATESTLRALFDTPAPDGEGASTTQFVTAMCALLSREYSSLGYQPPTRCATAYATRDRLRAAAK